MSPLLALVLHIVFSGVGAVLACAAACIILSGAVGGDREEADAKGTRGYGVIPEVKR